MRIPSPSDVLIGVSPVSLGFATLLAKGGLNVLVIDESEGQDEESLNALNLSLYCAEILGQHGYQLNKETTEKDFTEQSLSLLAHSLCCVIWGTQLKNSSNKEHQLIQGGMVQQHHSNFVFNLSELEITIANNEANFINVFATPGNVQAILKKACYDCHSNESKYPWYANVQPFGWFLEDHIQEGRKELNFSTFASV